MHNPIWNESNLLQLNASFTCIKCISSARNLKNFHLKYNNNNRLYSIKFPN